MTATRSGYRSSRSPQLGQALTALFTALYKSWYALPKKSTRRHIDLWRKANADQLPAGDASVSEITGFLDELAQMTGVEAAAGDKLRTALQAAAGPGASIPDDEQQSLATLLSVDDPLAHVIQQMVYVPGKQKMLFDKTRAALGAVEDRLPADIQSQLRSIWAESSASIEDKAVEDKEYEEALTKLEAIPTVIRLTHQLFLQYKQTERPASSVDAVRRTFDPNTVTRDGGHSALESMSTGSRGPSRGGLEAMSPDISASDPADGIRPGDAGSTKGISTLPAAMAGEPAASDAELTTDENARQFFPDVRFPKEVKLREEEPLVVQLTQQQSQESRVQGGQVSVDFSAPDEAGIIEPEYVEVVLSAPGLSERTDIWSRTILVHADQDSQPAVFLLRAQNLGDHRLTIAFYHNDRQLGQVEIATVVSNFIVGAEPTLSVPQAEAIAAPAASSVEPADLELRITKGNTDNQLAFMLHSSKSQIGYHWRPMGEITLVQENPQTYLEGKFERMSQFAGTLTASSSDDEKRETMREIETIGEELFEDLFPKELKDEFWKRIKPLREKGVIQSMLITSDEPWIPWEMVKPYRYDDVEDDEEADGFLCQTFQFCRWLAGRTPQEKVEIQNVKTVIPDLDLEFAKKERDYFQDLENESDVAVADPLRNRDQVLNSARDGGFQLLHFALHGFFQPDMVNRSPLILEDGDELYPEDLVGSQLKGLRKSKPIVFLNACHTARINFALIGLGGWAEKMVNDARVSAFIGTLWEVNDELALDFSTKFYDELRAGHPLGQAFSNARTQIREQSPANPTWLAYTLYGDPNSQVTWAVDR